MKRIAAVVVGVVLVAVRPSIGHAIGHAGSLSDQVAVTVEPAVSDVVLGADLDISIDVTNVGAEPLDDLMVHIDITALADSGSVDPEDWTATLSKPVGVIAPGRTANVAWRIQPISPGTFSLYAVVLSANDDSVAASNVLTVSVADRRSLNPNGILPVALGAPALIGGLLVAQIRTLRRSRSRAAAAP